MRTLGSTTSRCRDRSPQVPLADDPVRDVTASAGLARTQDGIYVGRLFRQRRIVHRALGAFAALQGHDAGSPELAYYIELSAEQLAFRALESFANSGQLFALRLCSYHKPAALTVIGGNGPIGILMIFFRTA